MFDSLSKKISAAIEKLTKSGIISEKVVDEVIREIRISLLSADVSLEIVKSFTADIREKAIGQEVLKSLSPGQTMNKIVYDSLISLLQSDNQTIDFSKTPTKIMMVGLQGSGKTTTTAKLADLFQKKYPHKRALVGSIDVYRPAAVNQLRVLSQQINSGFMETDFSIPVHNNVKNLLAMGKETSADLIILDTAGRLQIDEEKMQELVEAFKIFQPTEVLLVADIMTGQEAINIARAFTAALNVSGIVLTRADGDSKGGVAISMKAATGVPIKYLGVGEKVGQLEPFLPERIVQRILDMGDIFTLMEKAQSVIDHEEEQKTMEKMMSGSIDLDDFLGFLKKISSMGGIMSIMKLLPQFQKLTAMAKNKNVDDSEISKNVAIICSMTKKEKKDPRILNASRRKRIATGSGTTVQDVNKLIKQYDGVKDAMKKLQKMSSKPGIGKFLGLR